MIVDYRFRKGANDTLVLQVGEEKREGYPSFSGPIPLKWRDALVEDLLDVAKMLNRTIEK